MNSLNQEHGGTESILSRLKLNRASRHSATCDQSGDVRSRCDRAYSHQTRRADRTRHCTDLHFKCCRYPGHWCGVARRTRSAGKQQSGMDHGNRSDEYENNLMRTLDQTDEIRRLDSRRSALEESRSVICDELPDSIRRRIWVTSVAAISIPT